MKIIHYILLTTLVGIIAVIILAGQQKAPQLFEHNNSNSSSQKIAKKLDEKIVKANVKEIGHTENSNNDNLNPTIFETSNAAKRSLERFPERLPGDLNDEAYIEIDTHRLKQMDVGDTFDIQIPQQGSSLGAEVDHITYHDNGDKTVEAFFPGMDRYFSAIFTIGNERSYAQISTPEGVYFIEAQGNYAWIASRASLVASHREQHQDGVLPNTSESSTKESSFDDVDINFDYIHSSSAEGDKP